MVFSSSHVWMSELGHKEGWVLQNWCFWTVLLEKTLESSLDTKEIQPVNPKGNQPWIFIGRTDAEAEALVLWPPDIKSSLTGKDPDSGKNWRQEKGATEEEMVGWHHRLNGYECEQTPGDSEGQESLASCSPWGSKESDTTKQLTFKYLFFSNLQHDLTACSLESGRSGYKFLCFHLLTPYPCIVTYPLWTSVKWGSRLPSYLTREFEHQVQWSPCKPWHSAWHGRGNFWMYIPLPVLMRVAENLPSRWQSPPENDCNRMAGNAFFVGGYFK